MKKDRYYNQFVYKEVSEGHQSMLMEMNGLSLKHPVRTLLVDAWKDFSAGRFPYDGATFVKERHPETLFEVAAFIHDWRNSNGYVGRAIDREMFDIMILLKYPLDLIIERYFFTRLTGLNVLRHRLRKNWVRTKPANLFSLSNNQIYIS